MLWVQRHRTDRLPVPGLAGPALGTAVASSLIDRLPVRQDVLITALMAFVERSRYAAEMA